MEKHHKTVIVADHKLFDLHLRETFEYRDLIFLLVRKDFVSQYKQTILGPLWVIIQPLLSTVVLTFIFGNIAQLTTADTAGSFRIPAFLFYMAGSICWRLFSAVLTTTSSTFIANRETMGKVYYPRFVAPMATAFSNLITFAIHFIMMVCFIVFYLVKGDSSITITPMLLLIPLILLQLILLSVGIGLSVSACTTKYRDLARLVSFAVTLWQYASPIAYGLMLVPKNYMHIYLLNPMTPIITAFRYAVFGFGYFNLFYYLVSFTISILVFFLGLILFSKAERTFMDTV